MSTAVRASGPASLASLPDKLKARIVAHLDEISLYADDEDWEDESDDGDSALQGKDRTDEAKATSLDADDAQLAVDDLFASPKDQRHSTLSAMSLVSKEWHTLVAPVIWRELWLYARSTESLLELAQDLLPRQAEHVKQLCLRESQFDTLLADDKGDSLPLAEGRALEVVEAIERLAELGAWTGEWELRCARARTTLLARIVEGCPNVSELDIEGPLRILRRATWDVITSGEDEEPAAAVEIPEAEVANSALAAVKALSERVTALSLLLPPDDISTEQHAVEFLEAYPSLKALELNVFVAAGGRTETTVAAQRKALGGAVASLKSLEELNLGCSNFVDDELAHASFFAPLKHLALGEAPDLTFASFFALVNKFSATLESLELDGTPATTPDDGALPPLDLPKLVALDISTPLEAPVLSLFVNAPLHEISIGECPQLTAKDVVAFLEAHKDTLRYVDLEEGAVAAEGDGADDAEVKQSEEVVAAWCEEHDVEFAVIEADDVGLDDDDDSEDESA